MICLKMPKELRFVSNLQHLIDKKGLNYSELHRRSGVSMTTIRNLTSGAKLERIDRSSTEKLSIALGCKPQDLYTFKWEETND